MGLDAVDRNTEALQPLEQLFCDVMARRDLDPQVRELIVRMAKARLKAQEALRGG